MMDVLVVFESRTFAIVVVTIVGIMIMIIISLTLMKRSFLMRFLAVPIGD